MEHFIVFEATTGDVLWRGQVPNGLSATQQLPAGAGILVVPPEALTSAEIDLDVIRLDLNTRIDQAAERVRSLFITPGSGQAMTYLAKQQEAAAYLADNSVATPFLTAEAAATGETLAELAATVSANAAQWSVIGSRIEAARRKAKTQIQQSQNIAEMASAAQVDWNEALTA